MEILDVLIVDAMILMAAYLLIKVADFSWWLSWQGKKDEMKSIRRELLEDAIGGLETLMTEGSGKKSGEMLKKTKSNSMKLMPPSKRVKTIIINWLQ